MTFHPSPDDDAYDPGDPKRSDYAPIVCVFCAGRDGHYVDCRVHGTEPA